MLAFSFAKLWTTIDTSYGADSTSLPMNVSDTASAWQKSQVADRNVGMVLFYGTFVAMKHQDQRGIPDLRLLDSFQLQEGERGEELIFSGVIMHGGLRLALRLFRDRASSGVRLEATFHRGPKENVPIWTAFVTAYAERGDEAWPEYEGGGLVSLAALRPPPYIFSGKYEPPLNSRGEYILQFTSADGMCHLFSA